MKQIDAPPEHHEPRLIDTVRLRDAPRTALVFGAGASVFYDVPLQPWLLARFMAGTPRGGARNREIIRKRRLRIRRCCRVVYPGLAPTDPGVALEEVFAAYELLRDDPRSTAKEVRKAHSILKDLLLAVRYATVVPGKLTQPKWQPFSRNDTRSPYAELLERLVPAGTQSADNLTLITFNYDVNLDRCVINLRGGPSDLDIDYGVVFANSRCNDPAVPLFQAPREGAMLVLRPHGGLTWFRCLACRSVFTTLGRQQQIAGDTVCWTCGAKRVDYVLVHPSYSRRYDDPLLTSIWGRTYEALVKSDRWIFIGYSLPPADFHFRALLRQALAARDGKRQSTDVIMVGVHKRPDPKEEFRNMIATYQAMFHKRLTVWRATENGFSDFVSQSLVP